MVIRGYIVHKNLFFNSFSCKWNKGSLCKTETSLYLVIHPTQGYTCITQSQAATDKSFVKPHVL